MSNFNWHPTKEGKVKFDIAVSYLGADHRNVALAVKTFQMAAEAGDLASRFNYSIIVLDPACSSHGSRKTAFQYLIELMLLDAPKAQDLFNDSFMSNDNQDLYDVSDIYYSKQEWSIAFSYLSLLYPRLSGVDAIKVLDRMITCCHSSGDYAEAIRLHELLLSKGIYDRLCDYASIFISEPYKDLKRSKELYQQAVSVGMDGEGNFGLAIISELQHETNAAIEYYYNAFAGGHSEAQNRLSIYAHNDNPLAMYYYGLTKSGLESIIWIFLSYNHGHYQVAIDKLYSVASYDSDAKRLLDVINYPFNSYSAVLNWLYPPVEEPYNGPGYDGPDDGGYDYWKDILS